MSHRKPNYWVVLISLILAQLMLYLLRSHKDGPDIKMVDLEKVPQTIGKWQAEKKIAFDKHTLELLNPDAYLCRLYTNNGKPLQVMILYGHRKETFHAPAYCYAGAGWSTVGRGSLSIQLEGNPPHLKANKFLLQKKNQKQLALYFYMQGTKTTTNLFLQQCYILMDRIRGSKVGGAYISVSAPIIETESKTYQLEKQFLAELFPKLIELLKS